MRQRRVFFIHSLGHERNLLCTERWNAMPSYMIQISYTPETLAGFIKKPSDRTPVIANWPGRLAASWWGAGFPLETMMR